MRGTLAAMTIVTVVALVGLSGRALAHAGHEHKVMGKVTAIDAKRIEVETTDGKKVAGVLGPDTKYLRDKTPAAWSDVKPGERVVIVVVEDKDKVQNVKQVLLGAVLGKD
jgi:hypothetical protein